MKSWILRGILAAIAALTSSSAGLADGSTRPVPTDAELRHAIAAAKDVYGEEYAKARTAEQKQVLAEKIFREVAAFKADPATYFARLGLVRDIAKQAGDVDLALQAVGEIAVEYRIDVYPMKVSLLLEGAAEATATRQRLALGDRAASLVAEALARDDLENAERLGEIVQLAARQVRDRALSERAKLLAKELPVIAAQHRATQRYRTDLERSESDPEANLQVGRYECFVKGNWSAGLPMLARGSDERFKTAAAVECDGGDLLTSADRWWDEAECLDDRNKIVVRLHAADLYRQALPQLSGVMKTRVEKRLASVGQPSVLLAKESASHVPPTASLPSDAILILTFEPATIRREKDRFFVFDLSGKGNHGELRGTTLSEGKAGQSLGFTGKSVVLVPGRFPEGNTPRTLCVWTKVQKEGTDRLGRHAAAIHWGNTNEPEVFGLVVRRPHLWRLLPPINNDKSFDAGNIDDGWHHHAVVHDGAEVRYYRNAELAKSVPMRLNTAAGPLAMGAVHWGDFVGWIDEVAVFDRALTEDEVRAVYDLGAQGRFLVSR